MPGGTSQGQQGQSSPLDRTASATGTGNGETGQMPGGGEMAGMDGSEAGVTGSDPAGQGGLGTGSDTMGSDGSQNGGFGGAPIFGANGTSGESGTGNQNANTQGQGGGDFGQQGNGTSGRRIIVIGDGQGVLTGEERVGNYDRDLDEQMQVFDGIILGRRQETIARNNEDGAGDVSTGSSGGSFGSDSVFESAPPLISASVDPNNNRTNGQLPDAPSDNREGDFQNQTSPNSNIPSDISDGSDDDIVARQLREAATAEQDVVLREKLWDEYRKYKEGVQARR
jgi:hypothetical protein